MSIKHIPTKSYIRACIAEKKVTRIECVIARCPTCDFGVMDNQAEYCGGCGCSLRDLQYRCEACGAQSLIVYAPYCDRCGHKIDDLPCFPINVAQTLINHQAAQQ